MYEEKRLQLERGSIGGSYFMVQLPDGTMEKRQKYADRFILQLQENSLKLTFDKIPECQLTLIRAYILVLI